MCPLAASSPAKCPPSSESECSSDVGSDIIGEKRFKYNAYLVDEQVRMALNFWRGIRKAQGVGVENTRRCK